MPREINSKIDALFVEGPDDGAVVNAFVKKVSGLDLTIAPNHIVRTKDDGGGHSWALRAFDEHIETKKEGARIGLIVDRDRAENDKWPAVRDHLRRWGQVPEAPVLGGVIVEGQYGIWMWPDNVSHGALEDFVAGIVPDSAALAYAREVCRVAKESHGAEYELGHAKKAALKVRSVWRDASAAGGYGHLVRNLTLAESAASTAFLAWFTALFLA
jgi:hypothetical protein